jgi:hypothetical protein
MGEPSWFWTGGTFVQRKGVERRLVCTRATCRKRCCAHVAAVHDYLQDTGDLYVQHEVNVASSGLPRKGHA